MPPRKRFIRLKEQTPNRDVWHEPADRYRRRTDGTLARGPFRAHTDRQGFLQTGNTGLRGPAVYFLGGSLVESMYADEDRRFVSQVERRLRDGGPVHRCFNGGYSGATTLQLINVLLNKIVPLLRPNDTVVLFVPQSDTDVLDREGGYWTRTERHSPLVPVTDGEYQAPVTGADLEPLHQLLDVVRTIRRTFHINLVLATSPMRDEPYAKSEYLRRLFADRATYDRVMTLRRDLVAAVRRHVRMYPGTAFIDAAALVAGRPELFYDDLHLNHAGQDEFARLLAAALVPLLPGGRHWRSYRVKRKADRTLRMLHRRGLGG
ncbi:hypothetical protein GCM10022377_02800 [Zhihengliuella alba]|uniref:SGNH hydrolase-type esterase domain-containing protein n=1 Tax=Zhihengliuella alba TaxID=547018 RepID=A0ABP7CRQ6_9MICC